MTTQTAEASATETPAAPEDSATPTDFDMVSEALAFDPFESADEETSPDGGTGEETPSGESAPTEPGTQVDTQQQTPAAAQGEASEETPAPGSAPAAPENPELALLKQQVETLQAALKAQTPAPAQPGETPPAPADSDAVPPYQFTIPTELMALLDSENQSERQQGIGLLSQGVARTVHETVMQQVGQIVQNQIPAMMQGMIAQQTQAQTIFQDFYDKYPNLNRPELRQLIVSTGQQVMNETGAQEWSPQLRDTIAQRVLALMGQAPSGGVPPQPQPAPAAAPVYTPNAGGARPASPGTDSEVADISNTLFG